MKGKMWKLCWIIVIFLLNLLFLIGWSLTYVILLLMYMELFTLEMGIPIFSIHIYICKTSIRLVSQICDFRGARRLNNIIPFKNLYLGIYLTFTTQKGHFPGPRHPTFSSFSVLEKLELRLCRNVYNISTFVHASLLRY